MYAADLQKQEADQALAFQKEQWAKQQQNLEPYLAAGTGAINTLSQLTATPGQGLLTPWTGTFTAPTAEQAMQTPGYQFQLQQGQQALENSAAARGGLLTGGTAKGIEQYAQGLASTNYQQAYQSALTEYQTAYNTFQGNQTNLYNRLAGVAGSGQTAATTLGQEGQAAASNVGNISLTAGAQQGQALMNAGTATASGYAGIANALQGGISGVQGSLTLQQLLQGGWPIMS